MTSTPPHLGSLQDEVTKPATLSIGLQIQVPQFIKVGDLVKVTVATKKYMERVKKNLVKGEFDLKDAFRPCIAFFL